jgi:hypothetical protein
MYYDVNSLKKTKGYEEKVNEIVQTLCREGLVGAWLESRKIPWEKTGLPWGPPPPYARPRNAILHRAWQLAGTKWPLNESIVNSVRSRLNMGDG